MAPEMTSKTKQAKAAHKRIKAAWKKAEKNRNIHLAVEILSSIQDLDTVVQTLLDESNDHNSSWTSLQDLQALNEELAKDEQFVSAWIEEVRNEDIQYRLSNLAPKSMSDAMVAFAASADSAALDSMFGNQEPSVPLANVVATFYNEEGYLTPVQYDSDKDVYVAEGEEFSSMREVASFCKSAGYVEKKSAADRFAWPGGYTLVTWTNDGDAWHPDCAEKAVAEEMIEQSDIAGTETYDEGPDEICQYCGETIQSSYGDPDIEAKCSYCDNFAEYYRFDKAGLEGQTKTTYACGDHMLMMPGNWNKIAASSVEVRDFVEQWLKDNDFDCMINLSRPFNDQEQVLVTVRRFPGNDAQRQDLRKQLKSKFDAGVDFENIVASKEAGNWFDYDERGSIAAELFLEVNPEHYCNGHDQMYGFFSEIVYSYPGETRAFYESFAYEYAKQQMFMEDMAVQYMREVLEDKGIFQDGTFVSNGKKLAFEVGDSVILDLGALGPDYAGETVTVLEKKVDEVTGETRYLVERSPESIKYDAETISPTHWVTEWSIYKSSKQAEYFAGDKVAVWYSGTYYPGEVQDRWLNAGVYVVSVYLPDWEETVRLMEDQVYPAEELESLRENADDWRHANKQAGIDGTPFEDRETAALYNEGYDKGQESAALAGILLEGATDEVVERMWMEFALQNPGFGGYPAYRHGFIDGVKDYYAGDTYAKKTTVATVTVETSNGAVELNKYDRITVTCIDPNMSYTGTYRGRIVDKMNVAFDPNGSAIWVTTDQGWEAMEPIDNIASIEVVERYSTISKKKARSEKKGSLRTVGIKRGDDVKVIDSSDGRFGQTGIVVDRRFHPFSGVGAGMVLVFFGDGDWKSTDYNPEETAWLYDSQVEVLDSTLGNKQATYPLGKNWKDVYGLGKGTDIMFDLVDEKWKDPSDRIMDKKALYAGQAVELKRDYTEGGRSSGRVWRAGERGWISLLDNSAMVIMDKDDAEFEVPFSDLKGLSSMTEGLDHTIGNKKQAGDSWLEEGDKVYTSTGRKAVVVRVRSLDNVVIRYIDGTYAGTEDSFSSDELEWFGREEDPLQFEARKKTADYEDDDSSAYNDYHNVFQGDYAVVLGYDPVTDTCREYVGYFDTLEEAEEAAAQYDYADIFCGGRLFPPTAEKKIANFFDIKEGDMVVWETGAGTVVEAADEAHMGFYWGVHDNETGELYELVVVDSFEDMVPGYTAGVYELQDYLGNVISRNPRII